MMDGKSWETWIAEYAQSHQNPINCLTHLFGIPMIAVSIPLFLGALVVPAVLAWAISLLVGGWALQFIGHAFEGKPPEFFKNWRFIFVGFRWWVAKVTGRV